MKPDCRAFPVDGPELTKLDKDRARSMADEGGASAALIEGEDPCDPYVLEELINDGRSAKAPMGQGAKKK
jgi:hypothetical protein